MASNITSISIGADYSSGNYGTNIDTNIWYYPVTIKLEQTKFVYKLTVPYLKITGPGNVVGVEAAPNTTSNNSISAESGMGDIIAAVSYSPIPYKTEKLFVDFTAKIKFPTADETRRLGTGEYDYFLQVDGFYSIDNYGIFGTIGYKIYGDSPDVNYENVYYYSLGSTYQAGQQFSTGLFYDHKQTAFNNGIDQQELTLFGSIKLESNKKLMLYIIKGISDGSPEKGLGLSFSYEL